MKLLGSIILRSCFGILGCCAASAFARGIYQGELIRASSSSSKPRVANAITTSTTTNAYYSGPYFYNDSHITGGPFATIGDAISTYWPAYQYHWNVYPPHCSFSYSLLDDGNSTGRFAAMYERGDWCGGGPE